MRFLLNFTEGVHHSTSGYSANLTNSITNAFNAIRTGGSVGQLSNAVVSYSNAGGNVNTASFGQAVSAINKYNANLMASEGMSTPSVVK